MTNQPKLTITVKKLAKDNNFKVLYGDKILDQKIEAEMIDRPGVEFCNKTKFFDNKRISIVGVKEALLLSSYKEEKRNEIINKLLGLNPPAIIFSGNDEVSKVVPEFLKFAKKYKVVLLESDLKTTPLMGLLYYYLHEHLAPCYSEHGVLVDIYGIGTLVIGNSGVGKSETALELIRKGHILVSDDLVEIREAQVGSLIGTAPKILQRFLEVRGIGIIDVVSMFGSASFRKKKRIHLVVQLEKFQENKEYDRIGLEREYTKYFNTQVAKKTIPVTHGRNIATLVESAAMDFKLKSLGCDSAYEFTEKVAKKARGEDIEDD